MRLTNFPHLTGGRRALVVLTVTILGSALANAALIPVLVSGPTVDGSDFAYNYRIDLLPDESLNPTGTAGVTCPGPDNTFVQCDPTGSFVTIYDIAGFASATIDAKGWGLLVLPSGLTPSTINGTAIDGPLLNVTFFYTGPEIDANGSEITFTGFKIDSTMSGTQPGNFSFQATKDAGDQAGNTDQGDGPVTVPGGGSQGESTTAEPASLTLLGCGLLLFGVGRRVFGRF